MLMRWAWGLCWKLVLKKPLNRKRDSETSNQMKKEGEILNIKWRINKNKIITWKNKNMGKISIRLSNCFQLIRNYQEWDLNLPMTQLSYKKNKKSKKKKKRYKIWNNSITFNLELIVPWFQKTDWSKIPSFRINNADKYSKKIKMIQVKTLSIKNKRIKVKIKRIIKWDHKKKIHKILKILMITNQKKWINQCYLTIKNRNWTHFHKVKNNKMK